MKQVDVLSEQDKEDIRDFARGEQGARQKAIQIHRTFIRTHGLRRGDPFFDFMSEVDNPCPDLLLRARARKRVLDTSRSALAEKDA